MRYTNLEARVQYLHTFLDFGSSECYKCIPEVFDYTNATKDDIEALITGAKYIKQLIPAIVNVRVFPFQYSCIIFNA